MGGLNMDNILTQITTYSVTLLLITSVFTDAFPRIAENDFRYYNTRRLQGDLYPRRWAKRESEGDLQYLLVPVEVSDDDDMDDDSEMTVERRGGAWSSSGNTPNRWSGSRRITPYYLYADGVNYKSSRPVPKINPNSWYGNGWYRILSRSNPNYRVGRRSGIY